MTRRFQSRLLVSILLGLTLACIHGSPRHVLTGHDTIIVDGLLGIQKTADQAVTTGLLSTQARQKLGTHLLPALQGARDLTHVLQAWIPGTPMPAQINTLATQVGTLIADIIGDFTDPATKAAALAYIASIQTSLLIITTSGGGQ